MKKIFFYSIAIFCISCAQNAKSEFADTLIINANVYTLSWEDPNTEGIPAKNAPYTNGKWSFDADAIAIKKGKILDVGNRGEMMKYKGFNTKMIDALGAVVIPGLIESHGHLQEIGEKKEVISLEGLNAQELVELVLHRSQETPNGEWIIASGWDEAEFANAYPDMQLLSEKIPNHPVVLIGLRGFGVMGNRLAFQKAGITENTKTADGGEILKDAKGHLKYVLLNSAKKLLLDKVPQKTLQQEVRMMHYGFQELLKLGFTTTHNLGVDKNDMEVYEYLAKKDSLPMRVHAFVAARLYNRNLINEWLNKGPTQNDSSFLQVRGFKGYYDGSLGSRGAEFLEEYSDKKDHTGVGGEAYGFYDSLMVKALDKNFQLAIHAIGDKANRKVLDLYENYFETNPNSKKLRHRIEHVQVVHPDDFSRFGTLNIVASMEPAHAVEDMPWAVDRIGKQRAEGAYAWRTLRKNGATVIFNSDFTGSDPSFFYAMYAAITKKKKQEETAYYPEQAFTKEETLRAYTLWAAYASKQEHLTGTVEKGKWADLTFVNVDILNASPEEILRGEVLKTVINGKIAFEK